MLRRLRDVLAFVLLALALGVLFVGVRQLGARDYLAAVLWVLTGLSLLRASVEMIRLTVGE